MSPSRRVLSCALFLPLLVALSLAAPASAQFFESDLRTMDLSTVPISRSPRLLGMGGLSIAVADRDHQLNLWDFAGLPVGALMDDSTSTFDLRPGTASLSGVHTLPSGRDRQDLAGRVTHFGIEAFHRKPETSSGFGLLADVNSLRSDRPFGDQFEVRQSVQLPQIMPIMGGRFPGSKGGSLVYALHLRFAAEQVEDQYRLFVDNAAGEFIGLNGTVARPPNFFDPDHYDIYQQELGASLSWRANRSTQFALGYAVAEHRIKGTNEGFRNNAETSEDRPYSIGRAALVGKLGPNFEYGVSGRAWQAKSTTDWRFSVSAGVGAEALTGRGLLLKRDEKASALDARAKWNLGANSLGASFFTSASKTLIDPPGLGDRPSLNSFLRFLQTRPGADTLALPDSIVHDDSRRYAWGWGGGASRQLHRTIIGVEYHYARDLRTSEVSGVGPRLEQWDVRGGLEYKCSEPVRGRLGYAYRDVDLDTQTQGNRYTANVVSAGLGYAPAGTSWSLESGYALEWRSSEAVNLGDRRQGRQNLDVQIHWSF